MVRELRFRIVLPILESGIAALFGGIGLWQRSAILSRPSFLGQTLWDTTARFHVWPWPYKFAAVLNLPALLGALVATIPIEMLRPNLPESVAAAPTLLFVWLLWFWVGSRLDRRWSVAHKAPWVALVIFTCVSFVGAFVQMGFLYTGYLPYGFIVWAFALVGLVRQTSEFRKPREG
jgi:hypothetical protein